MRFVRQKHGRNKTLQKRRRVFVWSLESPILFMPHHGVRGGYCVNTFSMPSTIEIIRGKRSRWVPQFVISIANVIVLSCVGISTLPITFDILAHT